MSSITSGSPSTNRSKPPIVRALKSAGPEKDVRNCKRGTDGGGGKKTGSETGCLTSADRHPVNRCVVNRHIVQTTPKNVKPSSNTDLCILINTTSTIAGSWINKVHVFLTHKERKWLTPLSQGFSKRMNEDSFMVRNLTQNRIKIST